MLELDARRARLYHFLHRRRDEALVAGAEQLYVHVDTREKHAAPMPPSIHARLQRLQAAHSGLPAPAVGAVRAVTAGRN